MARKKSSPTTSTTRTLGFKVHTPVMLPAHVLNAAVYNPNEQTQEEFDALKVSIREHGFAEPIVVQKRNHIIIGGHHRLKAIKEICVEDAIQIPDVPCIVLDVDDRTAKKLNLKFNRIRGNPNARLLGELLADLFPKEVRALPTYPIELAALAFEPAEANKFIHLADPSELTLPTPARVDGFGKSVTLSLEFSDIRVRDAVKKRIQSMVEIEKRKAGDIIADLLGPVGKRSKKSA